ncbi:hypothetical protein, partial [Rhodoplanes roseus]|uniref:hypothetical protein n=1 Tax=Rhodoplanes roseus TaxID=29409 RepID=UPI003CCB5DB7
AAARVAGPRYFGAGAGSPPGVPGGGITFMAPPPGGASTIPGSVPAGGQTTPREWDSWDDRLSPAPVVPLVVPVLPAPLWLPSDGARPGSTPGGQSSRLAGGVA